MPCEQMHVWAKLAHIPAPFCAADDIDTSKMQAAMEFVPIDQLAAYVDKKVCACARSAALSVY